MKQRTFKTTIRPVETVFGTRYQAEVIIRGGLFPKLMFVHAVYGLAFLSTTKTGAFLSTSHEWAQKDAAKAIDLYISQHPNIKFTQSI